MLENPTHPKLPELHNIHNLIEALPVIAKGEDSKVYKLGDFALKRYFEISLDKLLIYEKVTNLASELLNAKKVKTARWGELSILVNPILEVLELPNNFDAVSISPMVEGDNPNDLLRSGKLSQSDFNDLTSQLTRMSRLVVSNTAYAGINIIPWNTSILEKNAGETSLIVITDLCQRLGELKIK